MDKKQWKMGGMGKREKFVTPMYNWSILNQSKFILPYNNPFKINRLFNVYILAQIMPYL
jgi:hypothetical protein